MRARLTRLAPEEIAAAALLLIGILAVAFQPATVTRLFEIPNETAAMLPQAITFVSKGDRGTIAFDPGATPVPIVVVYRTEPSPRITIGFDSCLDALWWLIRTGGGVSLSCQR